MQAVLSWLWTEAAILLHAFLPLPVPPQPSPDPPHPPLPPLYPGAQKHAFSGGPWTVDAAAAIDHERRSRLTRRRLESGMVVRGQYVLVERIGGGRHYALPNPMDVEALPPQQSGRVAESGAMAPLLLTAPETCVNPALWLSGPYMGAKWPSVLPSTREEQYTPHTRLGKGAYGEVWRAINVNPAKGPPNVVLKRMFTEQGGEAVRLSGLREAYYGEALRGKSHISRFIEKFEEPDGDLWLVFYDEGYSLVNHLFQPDSNLQGALRPSSFWWSLKRHPLGEHLVRDMVRQMLIGLAHSHHHNVTHRDIKMANVLMPPLLPIDLRIADWGSAAPFQGILPLSIAYLYPDTVSPSPTEETHDHRPPEAVADPLDEATEGGSGSGGSSHRFARHRFWREPSYDVWGVGVVMLQMVLGRKDVFVIEDERKRAKLEHHLRQEGASPGVIRQSLLLSALDALCLIPTQNAITVTMPPLPLMQIDNISAAPHPQPHPHQMAIRDAHEVTGPIYPILYRRDLRGRERRDSVMRVVRLAEDTEAGGGGGDGDGYHTANALAVRGGGPPAEREGAGPPAAAAERTGGAYDAERQWGEKPADYEYEGPRCSDEEFASLLRRRDPSGVGLPNPAARDLLRRLLHPDAVERVTVDEALRHPWFAGAPDDADDDERDDE